MNDKIPKDNCTHHTIEINNLKKDMETRIRHEDRLMKIIENLESLVEKLNSNYYQVNSSLLNFADIPDKVRKLEDKSIIISMIEKGIWFIIGVGISVIIQQNYTATKEENHYKIENRK